MEQLLKITTTPIKVELQTQNSKLKMQHKDIQAKLKTKSSKLDIKTTPIKVKMDTFEARKSMGLLSAKDLIYKMADVGKKAISDLTARYAREGNKMAQIYKNSSIPNIISQRFNKNFSMELKFTPSVPMNMSWNTPNVDFNYQPSDVNTNWEEAKYTMEYIPGSVRLVVKEYPKINIQYIGDFNYVPPSANPNYNEEA